jgi:hypothetical protein
MKINQTLALSALLCSGLTFQAHCQSVTLGDATFDESSSNVRAEGFGSFKMEEVQVFSGYGDYAGFLKTRKCTDSEAVAGVKCVKCTTNGASQDPNAIDLVITETGARVTTVEGRWLAYDTGGNLRILKLSSGDSVTFEASATVTPPILLPANPAVAQSWNVLGKKMTVVALNTSAGGHDNLLKLKVEAGTVDEDVDPAVPSGNDEFEFKYFKSGAGLIAIESGASDAVEGSGWSLSE